MQAQWWAEQVIIIDAFKLKSQKLTSLLVSVFLPLRAELHREIKPIK